MTFFISDHESERHTMQGFRLNGSVQGEWRPFQLPLWSLVELIVIKLNAMGALLTNKTKSNSQMSFMKSVTVGRAPQFKIIPNLYRIPTV